MRLRAFHNVYPLVDIAEARRKRQRTTAEPMMLVNFVGWSTQPPEPPSPPAAQALLAGQRLGEAAQKGQPAAPRGRWRAKWLLAFLGLAKRARPS